MAPGQETNHDNLRKFFPSSTQQYNFMINIKKNSLNICFLELLEEIPRESKMSLAMVNESMVFELLRFYCTFVPSQ